MAISDRVTKGGLQFGPLRRSWAHICVDMQRMFSEDTEWHTPWMDRVLPNVVSLVELCPERTVFTRFIPPRAPDDMGGSWRRYYERWQSMTRDRLDPDLIGLLPELAGFVPPAEVLDKVVLSPWHGDLHARLGASGLDTLVISGAETEVCVLATIVGAIDYGYRVVVVTDAVCSAADATHDAMMEIYHNRFGMQVETVTTADLIAARVDGEL
jgi:nicotinamidase-related amidase